jgi:hypothetical protein
VLYLRHILILLQTNLAGPLDKELNLLMMFPVLAAQHWSLLVLVVKDLSLYAVDSGHLKIFGHSDMQYAPAIGALEKTLDLNRKQLTRSPTHLDACTIQPNSYDCGYHTALNAFSISDHIINAGTDDDEGNLIANTDLTTWVAPTSTPGGIRQYRKRLHDKVAALTCTTVVPAQDDDPKICTDDDSDDDLINLT